MNKENAKQHGNEESSAVEDLTPNEAEAESVKGGVFSFAKGGLSGAIDAVIECSYCGFTHSGHCPPHN